MRDLPALLRTWSFGVDFGLPIFIQGCGSLCVAEAARLS
jgi:hypothetical protein